jgi:hypothetical protein
MIVKIQKPLASSEPDPPFLIYNEARDFEEMTTAPEIAALFRPGDLKIYHKAKLVPDPEHPGERKLQILERVHGYNW